MGNMETTIHPEFMGDDSASPGACYRCLASRRHGETVVDWGFQIDYTGGIGSGWLQMCSGCVCEVASKLGMLATDKARTLCDDLEQTEARLAETEAQLDAAEKALDALKIYRAQPQRLRVDA